MPPRREIDCLIVGAGLAGLHCALTLKREHPYWRIVIAEAYNYIGGRVVTYHTKPKTAAEAPLKGLHWENGAGRIHESHHLIKQYIQKYKLTTYPIDPLANYRDQETLTPQPDRWPGLARWIESFLRQLPRQQLASSTIRQLLEKTVGSVKTRDLLDRFPYRSETETMRADAALHSLRSELGTYDNYYVVAEGLSAIIDGMVKDCKKGPSPVEFLLNHRLKGIEPPSTAVFSTPDRKSVV
jgi:monoamine oxidase